MYTTIRQVCIAHTILSEHINLFLLQFTTEHNYISDIYIIDIIIYTTFIKRSMHKQTCSNALIYDMICEVSILYPMM